MLKIKTDSNNQIDIENKSIEVSDRVSADGAVTISAKSPTEIKIIKATAAKAIVTDKGEIPITTEDAKSVRRIFNVIRSPITTNIEANKKDANNGLPNGRYTVPFTIHASGTQNNFPRVVGANPDLGDAVQFELHLDSGVKFYRDIVPAIKKTPEWKSLVAIYGNYFRFDFDDYADEDCHFFGNVDVTPHPTEEIPKVVTEQESFGFFVDNEEGDFELDLDNKDYEFEFGFELKSGCGEIYVNWQNCRITNYREDLEHPTFTEYPMFFSTEESVGTIVDRFKTLHPELDYTTRGAYYIQQNIRMPPTVKITDANKDDIVGEFGIYFYMEDTIGYVIINRNRDNEVSSYNVILPQCVLTIEEIRRSAIAQNPQIVEDESGYNLVYDTRFKTIYNPEGEDDGSSGADWNDAMFENVFIDIEENPGMYVQETIIFVK